MFFFVFLFCLFDVFFFFQYLKLDLLLSEFQAVEEPIKEPVNFISFDTLESSLLLILTLNFSIFFFKCVLS